LRPDVITAIICDDEPLLREQLQARLERLWPALDVVAACTNGREAIVAAETHEPDIAFLDIHMPVMNGLDAAKEIRALSVAKDDGHRTELVFVTAYDEHAVSAFERGAIDYVLKPFSDERLQETIARLQERLGVRANSNASASAGTSANASGDALLDVLRQLTDAPKKNYLQWIKASVGQTVRLIPTEDVLYFQSDEKYTRVVMADSEVLIRKSIKELLDELDPVRFWQIHRATIVNTRAIAGVVRGLRDQADLKLKGRTEILTVSRNYTHLFKQM
jgi:DNA-binding LytR/AlgR family response regulator